MANAAVIACQTKVNADTFRVPDVQIAIGFGREAGADFGGVGFALRVVGGITRGTRPAAAGVSAFFQIGFNDLAQEVADFRGFGRIHGMGGGGFLIAHVWDSIALPLRKKEILTMSVLRKSVLPLHEVMKLPLSIPNYQRPYKWTTKNVNQLIEDILENFEKASDKNYRLGTVVFHQESKQYDESKNHHIVDGQQRLVTLTLICYFLAKKPLEAKLSILNNEFNSLSKDNIQHNAIYIKNRIETIALDKAKLLEYIYKKCEVVSITLDDISEAFQFFDSQNSRGKTLEAYDLLKAFHLREMMECSDAEKNQCVERWEKSVEPKDGTTSLETIFDRLYRIRCWAYGESANQQFRINDIDVFKGINLSQESPYRFTNALLMSDVFFEYSKNHGRLYRKELRYYPFQIVQVIINGKRFFIF